MSKILQHCCNSVPPCLDRNSWVIYYIFFCSRVFSKCWFFSFLQRLYVSISCLAGWSQDNDSQHFSPLFSIPFWHLQKHTCWFGMSKICWSCQICRHGLSEYNSVHILYPPESWLCRNLQHCFSHWTKMLRDSHPASLHCSWRNQGLPLLPTQDQQLFSLLIYFIYFARISSFLQLVQLKVM